MELHSHIDTVYSAHNQLIIIGWLVDLDNIVTNAIVQIGKVQSTLPREKFVYFEREDVSKHLGIENYHDHGLVLVFNDVKTLEEEETLRVSLVKGSKKLVSLKHNIDPKEKSIHLIKENWSQWGDPLQKAIQESKGGVETLTELLPEDDHLEVNIDHLAWIPSEGYFISGWLMSRENLRDLVLCSNQEKVSFLQDVFWHKRQDIIDNLQLEGTQNIHLGFACLVHLKEPRDSKILKLKVISNKGANEILCKSKDWVSNPLEATKEIFSLFSPISQDLQTILNNHIGPAVQALWSNRSKLEISPKITSFGEVPNNPKTSVLIPLYGRYDFVEYQLSQFVNDPYMRSAEIIYINDDPKIQEELLQFCYLIQPIYQLGFKLAHADQNLGYAGANNWGAKLAKGKLLLLLNSDVMPKEFGWLAKMEEVYRQKENIGALGCKLLYEDESIQHAGMTFVRFPFLDNMWINEHLSKGLTSDSEDVQEELKEVTAVTAACLLINKETYLSVGGLSENYILGDFEDSDLCLKLIKDDYKNYYLPDVELYHLERQSQSKFTDGYWKSKITIYNCWQHTKRWNDFIEELQQNGEQIER